VSLQGRAAQFAALSLTLNPTLSLISSLTLNLALTLNLTRTSAGADAVDVERCSGTVPRISDGLGATPEAIAAVTAVAAAYTADCSPMPLGAQVTPLGSASGSDRRPACATPGVSLGTPRNRSVTKLVRQAPGLRDSRNQPGESQTTICDGAVLPWTWAVCIIVSSSAHTGGKLSQHQHGIASC